MILLAVFDLDGTLVDSRRDLADSVNALLADLGRAPLDQDLIGTMVGDGARQLVERALAEAGVEEPPADALDRFLAHYDRRLLAHTAPYDGVVDMLAALEARGIRRAVLTNKPKAATERVLAGLALRSWFDAGVIGAEGEFPRKPDPAGLLALAARAGVPIEATLMVGDGAQDVETARRAGARICGARYGFGFPTAAGLLDEPDWIVDTPMGLLALLQP
ncbi:MAG TPA: HAD-IA family hydrolase [Vicinamibacterales bacterium]